VLAAPRVYSDRFPGGDDWLRPVRLHELAQGGAAALRTRLLEVAEQTYPLALRDSAARPYLPLRRPEPRVVHRRVGLHDLVVAENSVSLADVEVLSSRARMQVAVVRVLAEFREDDLKKGRGTEKAKWSLSKAILKKLDDSTKTDDAETVTKHIARARAAIARKYEEATGLSLDENEIIESSRKGHRLNPAQVSVRRP